MHELNEKQAVTRLVADLDRPLSAPERLEIAATLSALSSDADLFANYLLEAIKEWNPGQRVAGWLAIKEAENRVGERRANRSPIQEHSKGDK